MNVSSGDLLGRFPYVRVGSGPRTLVVFPGLDDAMYSGRFPPGARTAMYWYFSSFVDDCTVYVVSRPRHLPADHDVHDMADDYAGVLEAELGPASVLGVSMGGLIAQSLAARHSDLVDRLVLANTGHRVADLETVDRFLGYADEHDWAAIRAELSAAMFSDWRSMVYPGVAVTLGRFLAPTPADPDDVRISLEAAREFDGQDLLADVEAPTLVFGGTEDPFFPESVFRQTAEGIPDADLALVRGAKHGAFHEWKPAFESRVVSFLAEPVRVTASG